MADFDPTGHGGVAAVGRLFDGGGAIDLFLTAPSGLVQTWYNPKNGWHTNLQGQLIYQPMVDAPGSDQLFPHQPAAVSWGPDRLDVFAVSTAGDLWHFWAEGESQPQVWSGGESLGHPGQWTLDSAPTAVSQAEDKITVFVRGGSLGTLWACVWDPPGQQWNWHNAAGLGWPVQPRPFAFSPAACSWGPDRIDLFTVTGSTDADFGGALEHTWQQDFPGFPHWHPTYWEAPGFTGGVTSNPVAVSWNDPQRIVVVHCISVEGASGVGITRYLTDHWTAEDLFLGTGWQEQVTGYPALCSWQPGRLDAFFFRADGDLQHGWNETGGDLSDWGWEHFTLTP